MIRKTIARAFGRDLSHGVESRAPIPVAAESREGEPPAVFSELHDGFRRAAERRQRAGAAPFRVSGLRTEMEGQEFLVEGDGLRCRVRNTMNGFLWLAVEASGAPKRESVLFVHPDALGESRLAERPAKGHAAFHFTSVPQLVTSVLGEAPPPVARRTSSDALTAAAPKADAARAASARSASPRVGASSVGASRAQASQVEPTRSEVVPPQKLAPNVVDPDGSREDA